MPDSLDLYLDGILCGRVTQQDGGNLGFTYSEEYTEEQTPLSLSMPIQVLTHPNKSIRAYLEGLLPDNENALKALGRRYEESPNNPFAILKHIGRDVAGAVEIYPTGETPTNNSDNKSLIKINADEIENQLRGKITEYVDGVIVNKENSKISLAGAQPKIALHQSMNGEWFTPTDTHPSTHILKPLTEKLKNQDVVEHLTMLAAKNLGLNVCDSEITSFNGLRVFIAKRYDREINRDSGKYIRLHQEDFCQAMAVAPSKKYQFQDGGPGVGQIARLISKLPIIADREKVGRAFFEGFIFNIYARCPDSHAKNYSVILTNKHVRLAPLYDLTTGVPYGFTEYSAMSVNRKYSFSQISEDDLVVEAKRLNIDEEWARERIAFIHNNMSSAFESAGETLLEHIPDTNSFVSVLRDITNVLNKPFT